MPIVYKGLVHAKDTKAGHTERFSILQQKNMEGCTQLIPVQLQVCGNSVNPISVVPDWKVP